MIPVSWKSVIPASRGVEDPSAAPALSSPDQPCLPWSSIPKYGYKTLSFSSLSLAKNTVQRRIWLVIREVMEKLPISSLTASLGFFDSHLDIYKSEKPYACLVPLTHAPKQFEQSNIHGSDKHVEVIDIRGSEDQFELDVNGFELVRHSTTFDKWHDGKSVVREYYPYIAELVKKVTGANVSYVYDHTVRLGDHVDTPDREREIQGRPSTMAHVDLTLEGARRQIETDFGPKAEGILSRRFQVINVWHPIVESVEQHPLSLCDARTAGKDTFPSDLIYPHTTSENVLVRYSEGQKWHFVSNQCINEAWAFKIVDSYAGLVPGIAGAVPHTSFQSSKAPQKAKPRESIEFRTYAFHDSEEETLDRVAYSSV